MKWIKKGRIFSPDKNSSWSYYYGILPTPIYLQEKDIIRIYFATSGKERYCGITYMDVSADNPSNIVYQHNGYVLDVGKIGQFDDCGINPSSVVKLKNKTYLYYVGYQRCQKSPYMLFPGLAIEDKDGKNFNRYSNAPIIDRSQKSYVSHAAPYVVYRNGKYKMWLWIGKQWISVKRKPYISASIGYAESKDGINWHIKNTKCIEPDGVREFSLGRPWVIFEDNKYKMWYSVRYFRKLYRLGYAESKDGIKWTRQDSEVGIDVSKTGWDSEMICYPAVIKVRNKVYLFYNGNNNGETGFGYAVLDGHL
jgi:hypothetical protein